MSMYSPKTARVWASFNSIGVPVRRMNDARGKSWPGYQARQNLYWLGKSTTRSHASRTAEKNLKPP